MQEEHGWNNVPRVVVHGKASYIVNSTAQLLNPVFSGALAEAGFRSWTGPPGSSTKWLAAKLGDVYLHEAVISHIRRLLMEKFVCLRVGETFPQFKRRMRKVQDFMNSWDFRRKPGGTGLPGLAKDLRNRCGGCFPASARRPISLHVVLDFCAHDGIVLAIQVLEGRGFSRPLYSGRENYSSSREHVLFTSGLCVKITDLR